MKLTLIFPLLLLNNVLYGQEFISITIEPYLSFQHYEHFKRLTLHSTDSDVEFLEGFEFNWGYSYKLKVKQTQFKSRLSDGTEFEYSLVKLIAKTKVPDTAQFKIFLDGNRYYHEVDSTEQEWNKTLSKINDSTFVYFDEVEIEVPATLREKMKLIMEGQMSKMGTFMYVAGKRNRIRLIHL